MRPETLAGYADVGRPSESKKGLAIPSRWRKLNNYPLSSLRCVLGAATGDEGVQEACACLDTTLPPVRWRSRGSGLVISAWGARCSASFGMRMVTAEGCSVGGLAWDRGRRSRSPVSLRFYVEA